MVGTTLLGFVAVTRPVIEDPLTGPMEIFSFV